MEDNNGTVFQDSFSQEVWESTYKDYNDNDVNDTFERVAKAIASVEETEELRNEWTEKFYDMLTNFKVTAGGRIYSNAGTDWNGTTLVNCFVNARSHKPLDSLDGILTNLRNQAQTLKSEGGWGENFSYIRPRGTLIRGVGVETPGAVKYMEMFDTSSDIITSGSGKKSKNNKIKKKNRKGAQMSVLDIWHPDVVEFITAKQQPGRLTKFNVSVNCSDEFMNKLIAVNKAKENNEKQEKIDELDKWDLRFPDTTFEKYDEEWDGDLSLWESKGYPVITYDTVSASWIWNLIMESTWVRAEPGILFLDRANKYNPLNYAEKISATNPCVVGDALISTNKGLIKFNELVERFNSGEQFSVLRGDLNNNVAHNIMSNAFYSGTKETITLQLSNGMEITTTPDHKILTADNKWNEAKDCLDKCFNLITEHTFNENYDFSFEFSPSYKGQNGRLYETNLPVQWNHDLALVLGWLIGDGWLTKNGAGFIFGKNDGEMCERIRSIFNNWGCTATEVIDEHDSITLYLTNKLVKELFEQLGVTNGNAKDKRVPTSIFQAPKDIVSSFLSGLFSADGSVLEMKNSNFWVSLCSTSKHLLNDVQQLLLMFDITHHTTYHIEKSSIFEYINKAGTKKTYKGNHYYDLRIFGHGIVKFFNEIGFAMERKQQLLMNLQEKRFKNKDTTVKVTKIENAGKQKVYDITEPSFHNFVANSIVVHNCGEQTLSPGNICCLSSLNLTQFVDVDNNTFDFEGIKKYVSYLVRFLDNVNTFSNAPLQEYIDSMRKKRRIGIGILGWGSSLFMLKTRFGSDKAAKLRDQLMETIAHQAYKSSIDLAEEKGMFEYCEPEKHANTDYVHKLNLPEDYMKKMKTVGIRNSSLLSIQPNGNTGIFANIASGGLEPVFMPEYIRTVIVNSMPEHIADVCPRWYEGEWKETEMFKFDKEGDEEILRGTDQHGTVYKIDKNRGLTKEVLCEDYGVRWLKQHNQWDPEADWAVTTLNLNVQDHLNDLKGFSWWLDSACSKTTNVPYDYPFEDFKNIYLDAYNSGVVKGVTTYRAGTMTTVLSAKDEKNAEDVDEEIIYDDVKLPAQMPCVLNTIRAEGKKWYLTTVLNEQQTRPVAFFVHTNAHEKNVTTSDAVDHLIKLARDKGIPEHWIQGTEKKISSDNNASKIARAISLNLRHGVLIKNVVAALDSVEDIYVGSFLFQIKKFLSTYIKEGESVENEKCMECNSSNIVFSEGCKRCENCGSSRCG